MATNPPDQGHYFDRSPASPRRPGGVELTLPDLHVRLATDSSVFSANRIDPGTRLLLLEGPPPPPGPVDLLDLGCGYGPIAVALRHRAPEARVWAVDVNQRALELAAANLEASGGDPARVVLPEEMPPAVRFEAVYSNPPIRIGKAALHDLLQRWLGRLTPTGFAVLVVHRNLGADSLARWLGTHGWVVTRLGSRRGYRLLEVRRR